MIDKYWVERTGLGLVGALLVSLTGCGGESMGLIADSRVPSLRLDHGFEMLRHCMVTAALCEL